MRKSFLAFLLIYTMMIVSPATQLVHAAAQYQVEFVRQSAPIPPTTPVTPADSTDEIRLVLLNRPFTVALRQTAAVANTVENLKLQLTTLISDTRCPAQVNCVVAGQALFALAVQSTDDTTPFTAEIGVYPIQGQNKVHYGAYEIELTAVEPTAPPPGQRIKASGYRVTLVVRRAQTLTPVPTTAPPPVATITPVAPATPPTTAVPTLNRAFALRVGETAELRDRNFRVTLRSLSEDSGCLTPTDCSMMMADGTLVLQQGDHREILTFITSFADGQSFDYEFKGYRVRLMRLATNEIGEQVATFVVESQQTHVVIPEPERVLRCPSFSIYDAAAILQEEVEPRGVTNLVLGPIAAEAEEVSGFCGYLAAAYDRERAQEVAAPYIASDVSAVRGVIGTVIDSGDTDALLQFAQLLAASADGTPDAYYQLQAELAAGFYEDVINTFGELAAETATVAVTPVDEVGDEGVWFWQPLDDGYFGMLVARDGARFRVVTALLNNKADGEFVLEHAVVVARHLE